MKVGRRIKEKMLARLVNPRCKKCGLYESSCHVCIMGKGCLTAKIALIGEAPGAMEAKTGKPFMGRSGQLLDRLLTQEGIDPRSVFITNAVRCRPPDNMEPDMNELEICSSHYLRRELEIVAPRAIILLGHTALNAFFPHHGDSHKLNGPAMYAGVMSGCCYIKATYHPAYCLRNPSGTEQLVNAIKWSKLFLK